MIGRSPRPTPPPVLSPSSILPPRSSHYVFISASKWSERFSKMLLFRFFNLKKGLRVVNCVTWNCVSREVPVLVYNEMSRTCSAHWGWTQDSKGRSSRRRVLVLEGNIVATVQEWGVKLRTGCPWLRLGPSFSFGAFAKFRKTLVGSVMFVRPSVRMEQLGSHWTDINES